MMGRLRVIDGTPPPDTPAERVRARIRKTKTPGIAQCVRCGGRETIRATIGNVSNKLCVCCLLQGQRVVVE
jgi:hypothetical protein